MQKIKQNIWFLYQTLLVSGLLIFSAFCYTEYQNVKNEFKFKQLSDVNLLTRGIYSYLVSIEGTLDMIGHHIIEYSGSHSSSENELDSVLSHNRQIAAFGIIGKDGVVTATTSNIKSFTGFNMNNTEITKKTFQQAIESKQMIIGETYYHKQLKKIIIPVRKSIRDSQGNVKFVSTAGISLDNFLFEGLTSNDELSYPIMLIGSNKNMIYKFSDEFINQSIDEKKEFFHKNNRIINYELAIGQMTEQSGKSIKEIMGSNTTYSFTYSNSKKNVMQQMAARYDKEHSLWIVSQINYKEIWLTTIDKILVSLISFLIFNVIFYFLVLSIAKSDSKKRRQLIYQANHDSLTKLPNRFSLRKNESIWTTALSNFSVIFIDLDKFKNINDSHGHKTGDNILIQVSERLKNLLNEGSVLYRESGDEFIVLTKTTNVDTLTQEANAVIEEISRPYEISGTKFVLGASIGISQYPQHGTDIDTLIKSADIAMYKAKSDRNSVRFFDLNIEKELIRKISIEQGLRQALVNGKIFMAYQPQIAANNELYGVEALVRWIDDELGFVGPDEFIPVAEDCGMMPELGRYIMNEVMSDITNINNKNGSNFQTSINISVKQIMSNNFYDTLIELIDRHSFDTSKLTLEITETLFVEEIEDIKEIFTKIKALGIKISLDDFGTGYSSLSMLNRIEIDELKIDRSFIMNITDNEKNLKMVQNIISIGKNLEMKVLAEGVETKNHQEELEKFDCDLYQGYYFSRPLSISDFEKFINEED